MVDVINFIKIVEYVCLLYFYIVCLRTLKGSLKNSLHVALSIVFLFVIYMIFYGVFQCFSIFDCICQMKFIMVSGLMGGKCNGVRGHTAKLVYYGVRVNGGKCNGVRGHTAKQVYYGCQFDRSSELNVAE